MDALGSLLIGVGHLIRRRTAAALEDLDLDPRTAGVLLALRQDGPSNLTELGTATRIDRTSIGQRVDALVARGLVGRLPTDGDRRMVLVDLTPEGVRVAATVHERVDRIEVDVTHPLDPDERQQLRSLLHRVVTANLTTERSHD